MGICMQHITYNELLKPLVVLGREARVSHQLSKIITNLLNHSNRDE